MSGKNLPIPKPKTRAAKATATAVLQVLPRLKEGGVEESTIALARYLLKPRAGRVWAPHVAAAVGKRAPELKKLGVPVHALPLASKNPLVWLWLTYKLVGVIRAHTIKLVHARSRACAWPAYFAARWCGVPFVTTFHGNYGLGGGWPKRFYNSIMVAGPLTIANSHYTAQHIVKHYHLPPARIIVAPRGADVTQFNPKKVTASQKAKILTELNVPAGYPLLLMVGRLTPWKGQHLLLEALALLPHRKFVVAFVGGEEGKGHYAADLLGFTKRLGLTGQVRWLGARRDVPKLLACATLAFSCSKRPEAFGRVAIESMAMGVPIIASAHGGSLETITPGKVGWLVPVSQMGPKSGEVTPQALSDVIQRALRNKPRLATMGQQARAHVLATYTEARMCAAELSAYTRLLGLPHQTR